LPYRNIFAVLTWDSVIIYDTFHEKPLSISCGLHYANIVDASWTADGHTLLVGSTDGYISILRFAPGELGDVYHKPSATRSTARDEGMVVSSFGGVTQIPLPPCEPGSTSIQAPLRKKTRIAPTPVVEPPSSRIPNDNNVSTTNHKRTATAASMAGAVDKLSLMETFLSAPSVVSSDIAGTTTVSQDIIHTPPPPQTKKQKKRIQPMQIISQVSSSS
jgi:chromatin assembly factor 1 subunit B